LTKQASTDVLEKKMTDHAAQYGPSIHYCKGHGWQVLSGVSLALDVMRDCQNCKVIERTSVA
jgi:hypothetical protein